MKLTKADRARMLAYKRPMLSSLGFETIRQGLCDISEACCDVHWFIENDSDTLLNALDGDENAEWEFKMAFAELETNAEILSETIEERSAWDDRGFETTFNDCTVSLIGSRYKILGFDSVEEDYFSLTGYEQELAYTDAGKRLMRLTKAEMLSTIGQCMGIALAFYDLQNRYDYLKAAMDILRDENTSLLKIIKEIEEAYETGSRTFDRLLEQLPARIWIE